MASADLSRRVEKVVGYGLLWRWTTNSAWSSTRRSSMPTRFERLPGKWQAAIMKAEQNRPKLWVVGSK